MFKTNTHTRVHARIHGILRRKYSGEDSLERGFSKK